MTLSRTFKDTVALAHSSRPGRSPLPLLGGGVSLAVILTLAAALGAAASASTTLPLRTGAQKAGGREAGGQSCRTHARAADDAYSDILPRVAEYWDKGRASRQIADTLERAPIRYMSAVIFQLFAITDLSLSIAF